MNGYIGYIVLREKNNQRIDEMAKFRRKTSEVIVNSVKWDKDLGRDRLKSNTVIDDRIVDAIQWSGFNDAEIREFAGKETTETAVISSNHTNHETVLEVHTTKIKMKMYVGSWIIKSDKGDLSAYKGKYFVKDYEPYSGASKI